MGLRGTEGNPARIAGANIKTAGAGRDSEAAGSPAVMEVEGKSRVMVFSYAMQSSGVPSVWAASGDKWGVNLLPDLSAANIDRIARRIRLVKRPGDIVVASIHWGGNWGYPIPGEHVHFAHYLIDEGGVDIVHGHSSHHPLGMEVYHGKPILYGCGDFLNDYEGISGYEQYRDDLALMYFARMDINTGKLEGLEMAPAQIKRFRSSRPSGEDVNWLLTTLGRECAKFHLGVDKTREQTLQLRF